MEILCVKLTWFSAESSRLVILVLYFTLIWSDTSDWVMANIQIKAPPQCLSLSLLIEEQQVVMPEWELNYPECIYMGVWLCSVTFLVPVFAQRFRAAPWSPMLWTHHTIDFENEFVSCLLIWWFSISNNHIISNPAQIISYAGYT